MCLRRDAGPPRRAPPPLASGGRERAAPGRARTNDSARAQGASLLRRERVGGRPRSGGGRRGRRGWRRRSAPGTSRFTSTSSSSPAPRHAPTSSSPPFAAPSSDTCSPRTSGRWQSSSCSSAGRVVCRSRLPSRAPEGSSQPGSRRPGRERRVRGGVVAYSNEVKMRELGCRRGSSRSTAPCRPRSRQRWRPACATGSAWTSGSPSRGSRGQVAEPPRSPSGSSTTTSRRPTASKGRELTVPGDRQAIRSRATVAALHLARRVLTRSRHEGV